jgi:hypothetical protein
MYCFFFKSKKLNCASFATRGTEMFATISPYIMLECKRHGRRQRVGSNASTGFIVQEKAHGEGFQQESLSPQLLTDFD